MIKIYFSKGYKPSSRLIQYMTNSDISHVAIGDIERNLVLHATSDGLHFSHKNFFFNNYDVKYSYAFLPSDINHLKYNDTKECFLTMLELLETPFDLSALAGFIPYLILKKMGYKDARNYLGKTSALYCSEVFLKFLTYCSIKGIIDRDVIAYYNSEEFSPADALKLIKDNQRYFTPCEK